MNAKARQLVTAILAVILALTMGQAGAFAYAQDPGAAGQSDPTEPTKTAAEMVRDSGTGTGDGSDPSGPGGTDPGNLDPGSTGSSDDTTTASGDETETPSDTSETTTESTTKTTTKTTTKATKPSTTTTKAKPTVPKVKVTPKGSGLRVGWTKIQGVNYYEVYRSYERGKKGKLLKRVRGKTAFRDVRV